ncbi:MAG: helix-turn-helix transcriptional regulator [Selenomonadaceae bacterium]|nr:helix-turn-helix transcriptional regulator [Selenomonadaceae bacterium]MBO6305232.1 helix-turn-helix transcriptional regulator [Selenomonadaceae bacterium]
MAKEIKADAPYADFAHRLRQLKRAKRLTRTALAEKCGLVPATLVNYENGERMPAADIAAKMAAAFGITIDELMGVNENEETKRTAMAVERIRRLYGKKQAMQIKEMLKSAEGLFAGGELPPEVQDDYILEAQKLFIFATEKAKEKYTPKKYRTEERATASRERLREIDAIDDEIRENNRYSGYVHPYLRRDWED